MAIYGWPHSGLVCTAYLLRQILRSFGMKPTASYIIMLKLPYRIIMATYGVLLTIVFRFLRQPQAAFTILLFRLVKTPLSMIMASDNFLTDILLRPSIKMSLNFSRSGLR